LKCERYGKYGRKISWIVKWFGKYRRKLWSDRENMECATWSRDTSLLVFSPYFFK
jgi:hypothetical protein